MAALRFLELLPGRVLECSQNIGVAPRILELLLGVCFKKSWEHSKILGALQNPGSTPKSWEHFKILGVLQNSGSTPKSWEHSKILGVLQNPESSHPFLHHVTFMRMTKKAFYRLHKINRDHCN